MIIDIDYVYNKRSNRKKSPATYTARQNSVGGNVRAIVRLDPILKGHSDLRRLVKNHEKKEIEHWASGNPTHVAHNEALKNHQHVKDGKELWKIIDRRNRK
jgi:hypothetical protein